MLCDNCGKREATVKYEENINGEKKKVNLCVECGNKLGIFNMSFMDNIFMPFFDEQASYTEENLKIKEIKCPKCNYTFSDYANSGLLGCDECYTTFITKLEPILYKLHGKSQHVKLKNNSNIEKPKNKLEELQIELENSIEKEEYEKAAIIRDEIKKIKERGDK